VILELVTQRILEADGVPSDAEFREWTEAALGERIEKAELVIRIVDEAEIRTLNREYRGMDRPTNVLSFPSDLPPEVESDLLGDLVISAPVVQREAEEQEKPLQAHWAHMVIHGVLHLTGFDHQNDRQALEMEFLERSLLEGLGFPDPYS